MSIAPHDSFQEFFEDERYLALKNHLYNYHLRKRAVGNMLRYEEVERLLEVGSGISPVVSMKDSIVYSDISFLAMKTLRQMIGGKTHVVADGVALPFKNGCFSHVVASEVLEHLQDDRKALREIARVMKPSGVLILTFPHRRWYFSFDDRFVGHYRRYELAEMKERLCEVGLHMEKVRKVLGPLEKLIMSIVLYLFASIRTEQKKNMQRIPRENFSSFFLLFLKWMNRVCAVLAMLDAFIMPRKLSAVLLIRAVKS